MKILIFIILTNISIYSQEYVTAEELEEGWGFKYLNQLDRFDSNPKNEISFFEISPDEELISINTNIRINNTNKMLNVIYNMKSKEFVEYNWIIGSNCTNDYEYCLKASNYVLIKKDRFETFRFCYNDDKCFDEKFTNCYIGEHLFKENEKTYSIMIKNIENDSNEVYKIDIENIFRDSCPSYEFVTYTEINHKGLLEDYNFIYYPINSINFQIKPIIEKNTLNGFLYYKNFKLYDSIFIPKHNNWIYSNLFEFSGTERNIMKNSIRIGKHDDIYAWISYRLKEEITDWSIDPRIHTEAKEARDASGIYRMDTNGQNAVQLVRSWPHNPGGLQISGDGETIYYAYILPDSTSAIMKMDRYGKNKEIVFKLDPEVLSIEKQVLTPKIYPNPANETVTISGIEQGKLEIYDTLGKLLFTKDFIGQSQIDVNNFITGVYILKLESGGFVKFEKLLINK